MLGKVKNEPPEEEIGLGIWNSIGTWFGYEPTERPVRPHAPTPDVIYPEILVIIDYELYASFDTLNELVSRLYAFWEGVDKLYAPLSNPKFKLSIAGVLVPTVYYTDVKSSMDSWLYKYKDTFSEDTYDVFIVMTPSRDNGLFSTTIGLSTLGGVCNVDNFTQRLSRGAIIFETPDFKDTLTAAHELGHL
ncbi:hypothetical protein G9C98_000329 [Cotesia typhae]|uniref:Uncharacterized protein n=1 Tax=Cotesia typhae TaxID=2053667 RepID=A0A8J5R613_9HYME|nr:hypothetical protein G9C98_000329 [Cotesia typhae]